MVPLDLVEPDERPGREATERSARKAGTPFGSLFTPSQMLDIAREAGFRDVRHVPATALAERYFAGREDRLRPSSSEKLVVATTWSARAKRRAWGGVIWRCKPGRRWYIDELKSFEKSSKEGTHYVWRTGQVKVNGRPQQRNRSSRWLLPKSENKN